MSYFDHKNQRDRESVKTLASVIFMLVTAIIGSGIMIALADFRMHLWFWGIGH